MQLVLTSSTCDFACVSRTTYTCTDLPLTTSYPEVVYYFCTTATNNRVSMVDAVFFALMMAGASTSSLFNNRYWAAKFILWLGLAVGSVFLDNSIFDDSGYVWPARFGAFLYIILQQIVLIDIAYKWNDSWVAKAQELGEDSDGKWYLIVLVAVAVLLYACALSALGVLFGYFTGCADSEVILSLTLVLCVIITVVQLSGVEGNLLASAAVSCYAVFLAFSA
eukprot:3739-Heterococcus_DN1.PRE.2